MSGQVTRTRGRRLHGRPEQDRPSNLTRMSVDRSTPAELTFTAIICAYTLERWDDISAAVASLRAQTSPVDEIVLVSDHNDELLARATAAFPDIRCLQNTSIQRQKSIIDDTNVICLCILTHPESGSGV